MYLASTPFYEERAWNPSSIEDEPNPAPMLHIMIYEHEADIPT